MKDRQFLTLLGLVVAAGLVMGLIASRLAAGSVPVANPPMSSTAIASPDATLPSSTHKAADPSTNTVSPATDADLQNDESSVQEPATDYAPGTAAEPPPQSFAPAELPSASAPQSNTSSPQ